jgi:protein involved in polysaccharide export with SLBB domain
VTTQSPLSHDYGDYRRIEEGPKRVGGQSLPLFGYEIFKNARELNDAQRTFIMRQSVADLSGANTGRSARSRDATTGDVAPSGNSSRTTKRPPVRRRTDNGTLDNPDQPPTGRDVDTGVDDGSDPALARPGSSRRRIPRRSTQEYDPSQDSYGDSSNDSRYDRSGDTGEPDVQNAYAAPVGPISLLYRGIAASVPDNYTLASGDELRIRIDSPTVEEKSYKRTVDSRGQIRLNEVGNVVVRGKTISSAEKMLEISLGAYIKNARVSIETGVLRTMPILVTGNAYEPGSYILPATATAFNVLNIAGGPTDEGSLRDIQVLRQGKKIATLDIYKMISGDARWADVQLAGGDVIVIPPRRSRITVSGEVLHPAVFELLPTETLREALGYAGGIKATGLIQSVRVNTVVPGEERVIKDVDVSGNNLAQQKLFDGDHVEVFSVRSRLNNRVSVEGAVEQPNDYQLLPGMRVADLIDHARGTLSEAYLGRAELHRWQPDNTDLLIGVDLNKALAKDPSQNLELQKWDRLKVYTREEVAWTGRRKVYVDGAVKRPGVYDVSKNMHVSDLLRMANGPTPDADLERAHLFHHHDDGPNTHEYVNVAAAVKGDPNKDPEVFDSDRLILYTASQSAFTPDHRVDIKGEVAHEGRYERFEGMRLSDLLNIAGGFKPSAVNQVSLAHARRVADASAAKVVTINFDQSGHCAAQDDVALEDGDVVAVQALGGYEPEVQSIMVGGAVNKPGPVFLKGKNMRLSDAIKEAGGPRPEAFPDGATFFREPNMLATTGQRSLVQSLAGLNDLLNDSETKRELAKAQIELIKATGNAVSDSVGIGALAGGGAAAAAANPAASAVASNISSQQLVSPARKLAAGQLDPNGFVAIDLRTAMAHPKGSADIILVNGDQINVPETPTTVTIIGAVNSSRGVLYDPGKRLEYYLDLAGGPAPDAARDRIEIFHLGGGVNPANRSHELKPGDVVFVPTKVLAAKIAGKGNGFDSFFKSLTSSAIVFKLATGIFGL